MLCDKNTNTGEWSKFHTSLPIGKFKKSNLIYSKMFYVIASVTVAQVHAQINNIYSLSLLFLLLFYFYFKLVYEYRNIHE